MISQVIETLRYTWIRFQKSAKNNICESNKLKKKVLQVRDNFMFPVMLKGDKVLDRAKRFQIWMRESVL